MPPAAPHLNPLTARTPGSLTCPGSLCDGSLFPLGALVMVSGLLRRQLPPSGKQAPAESGQRRLPQARVTQSTALSRVSRSMFPPAVFNTTMQFENYIYIQNNKKPYFLETPMMCGLQCCPVGLWGAGERRAGRMPPGCALLAWRWGCRLQWRHWGEDRGQGVRGSRGVSRKTVVLQRGLRQRGWYPTPSVTDSARELTRRAELSGACTNCPDLYLLTKMQWFATQVLV